ncbi:MAG: hypothetical protein KF681_08555 [Bdellovibrionaceae bacterium]|nr:hypothetical protein [Pseudobdellovibrionaceae bacterium]
MSFIKTHKSSARDRAILENWIFILLILIPSVALIFGSAAYIAESILERPLGNWNVVVSSFGFAALLAFTVTLRNHSILKTVSSTFSMGILKIDYFDLFRLKRISLVLTFHEIHEIRIASTSLSWLKIGNDQVKILYVTHGPTDRVPRINIFDVIWKTELDEKVQPFLDAKIPVRVY